MKKDKAFAPLEEFVKAAPDAQFSPDMKKQVSDKVEEAKEKLTPILLTDKWIYRYVVWFLGLSVLASVFFTFYLSVVTHGEDIKMPDIFLAIGSAAVGALAGLLAPSPMRGGNE